jgi:hypothetical protein
VAKKRAQRSGAKKATKKPSAGPKPAAKAPAAKAPVAKPAPKPAARAAAPARPAPAARVTAPPPSLLEQARSLRDAIERSKQTAADPWGYTTKARGWLRRADQVLDRIAASADAAGTGKTLEALRAEVEADRDFREARRLF